MSDLAALVESKRFCFCHHIGNEKTGAYRNPAGLVIPAHVLLVCAR